MPQSLLRRCQYPTVYYGTRLSSEVVALCRCLQVLAQEICVAVVAHVFPELLQATTVIVILVGWEQRVTSKVCWASCSILCDV